MARPVPRVSGLSREKIELIAERALGKLMPEAFPIKEQIDILRFFDRLDLYDERLVPGVEKLGEGVLGQMNPDGEILLSPATFDHLKAGKPRARFTAAHECGHAILHFSQMKEKLTDGGMRLYRRSDIPAYLDPEWQANAFGAALLMPRKVVKQLMEKKPNNRKNAIARFFNVSQEAALIRIKTLNLN